MSHSFPNDSLDSLPLCGVLNSVCNQFYFVSVIEPCEITPEIREAHDLQNKREKSYLRHGESQDFYCKYRQNIGWTRASITCSDGKLNVEPCESMCLCIFILM